MTDNAYDQTQFITEEPLYERPVQVVPTPVVAEIPGATETVPKKSSKKRTLIIVGLILFLLLIGVILIAALRRGSVPTPTDEVTEAEQEEQEMLDPFRQQIKDLQSQLKAVDPTQNSLPFPPVEMDIRLEQ
jgi:hypothetical protein